MAHVEQVSSAVQACTFVCWDHMPLLSLLCLSYHMARISIVFAMQHVRTSAVRKRQGWGCYVLNFRCALSRVSLFSCTCLKGFAFVAMSEPQELDTLTSLPWEVLEYILSYLTADDLGRQAPSASEEY